MRQEGARRIYSVGDITKALWRRFEDIPSRWIEGEITNLGRRGQQVYFTLVDPGHDDPTQIDASMNGVVFDAMPAPPADGALVHAYGRVEFWRRRSQVRLRVERLSPTGTGALLARIAELTARLRTEGLLDEARKRPIPRLPRRIGLVTSRDGAARADFVRNVTTRMPGVGITVVHSLVQGDQAPRDLVRAIRHLDRRPDVDVIVVARGGGALEDLMAFNSEAVCRAVAASGTPVVSAVGHETDVTLCDLVADLRVSTPTKAAEAVVADRAELAATMDRLAVRMGRAVAERSARAAAGTADAAGRLGRALRARGAVAAERMEGAGRRLLPSLERVRRHADQRVERVAAALDRGVADRAAGAATRVTHAARLLELLSPERTVARGYVIVRSAPDGRIVQDGAGLAPGRAIELQFRDRPVPATVTRKDQA